MKFDDDPSFAALQIATVALCSCFVLPAIALAIGVTVHITHWAMSPADEDYPTSVSCGKDHRIAKVSDDIYDWQETYGQGWRSLERAVSVEVLADRCEAAKHAEQQANNDNGEDNGQ